MKRLRRNTDPIESHLAAYEMCPHLGKLQRWVADCVRRSPGRTAKELAAIYAPDDPPKIHRRLSECEELGLVVRGVARRCNRTGRLAATWWPRESESLFSTRRPE